MGTELDTQYFFGLLAGEGTFVTDMSKGSHLTIGIRMRPACRIEMNKVDEEMLIQLCETLGFGKVRSRSNDMTALLFRSQDDIRKLIDLIESTDSSLFEYSHKYKCYQRWRVVAQAILNGEHAKNHERAKELVEKASKVNKKFGGHGKGPGHWKAVIDESKDLS